MGVRTWPVAFVHRVHGNVAVDVDVPGLNTSAVGASDGDVDHGFSEWDCPAGCAVYGRSSAFDDVQGVDVVRFVCWWAWDKWGYGTGYGVSAGGGLAPRDRDAGLEIGDTCAVDKRNRIQIVD